MFLGNSVLCDLDGMEMIHGKDKEEEGCKGKGVAES